MVRLRLLRHRELSRGTTAPQREDGVVSSSKERDETARLVDARRNALALLAYREYSAAELADRLESRGCSRHIAERTVQQLAEEGLQSDRRFIEVFIRSRVEKGQGPLLLRAELRARGIDETLIREQLVYDEDFWIDVASTTAMKRFRNLPENRETWAAQARFLARRGFPSAVICSALGDQHD
jgi:regulatory protein